MKNKFTLRNMFLVNENFNVSSTNVPVDWDVESSKIRFEFYNTGNDYGQDPTIDEVEISDHQIDDVNKLAKELRKAADELEKKAKTVDPHNTIIRVSFFGGLGG